VTVWEMNDNRWIWIRGTERKEFRFHTCVFRTELADLLAQAGFTPLAIYGKLDGGQYDSQRKGWWRSTEVRWRRRVIEYTNNMGHQYQTRARF